MQINENIVVNYIEDPETQEFEEEQEIYKEELSRKTQEEDMKNLQTKKKAQP